MTDKWKIHTSIIATYKPQGSQKFRCSENFPHWNTPNNGKLKFTVIVPEGYPQPNFSITHDKVGQDKTWYINIHNGSEIDVNSEKGDGGATKIYVGTTSALPEGLNGAETYAVIVWISN